MTTLNPVVCRWELDYGKEGFRILHVRLLQSGQYQMRTKSDHYGDRWEDIVEFTPEFVASEIEKYGTINEPYK
jgi:hypothetical protein